MVKESRPVIGITMGDPVGIGPELTCLALAHPELYDICRPLVFGDIKRLEAAGRITGTTLRVEAVTEPEAGRFSPGFMDVLAVSDLAPHAQEWGKPTPETGQAMVDYILTAADMAMEGRIAAVTTCPINKAAMKLAGSGYHGHTEMLAGRTHAHRYAMMMAGSRLRVVLVTIHIPLKQVPEALTPEKILETIEITNEGLKHRFGIRQPRMVVAGLNPHSGEEGMFGDEEARVIVPAVESARRKGINVFGPFPPDTVFYQARSGTYDAVVAMYHDQGLIPFKMIHFTDGVNTTLGLPIIRTSVDHGTAYDIAGRGMADPGSLIEAIRMAAFQARVGQEIRADSISDEQDT